MLLRSQKKRVDLTVVHVVTGGYTRLPDKIWDNEDLTLYEKAILTCLIRFPICIMSQASLAKMSGMGLRSAKKALNSLRDKGWIIWRSGKNSRETNEYRTVWSSDFERRKADWSSSKKPQSLGTLDPTQVGLKGPRTHTSITHTTYSAKRDLNFKDREREPDREPLQNMGEILTELANRRQTG